MNKPTLSVIIPTYNKASYLERSLASWCGQTRRDYELVVIDDGSDDETADVLTRFEQRLPLRRERIARSGRARARNQALRSAQGDLLLFCDDDRVVCPTFVEAHARMHETSGRVAVGWQSALFTEVRASESVPARLVGEVAGRLPKAALTAAIESPTWLLDAEELLSKPGAADRLSFPEWFFEEYLVPVVERYGDDISDYPLAWALGTTGNMSVSKALLDRVGGFATTFDGWGLEDTELHLRLVRAGARTVVCRDARNYHQNHPRDGRRLFENWVSNARRLLELHPELDVALYVHAALTHTPFAAIERLISESRTCAGFALVEALRKMVTMDALHMIAARSALKGVTEN